MAESFLEEIYSISNVIYELEVTITRARKMYDEDFVNRLNKVLPLLCECTTKYIDYDVQEGKRLWEKVSLLSQIHGDMIRISDIIDMEIVPQLKRWINDMVAIDQYDEEGYRLCNSQSGFLTIAFQDIFIHSLNNPMVEAYDLIEDIFSYEKDYYFVFGCGLGYQIYQIYQRIKDYGHIVLWEPSQRVLEYAKKYGVLDWIPADVLSIKQYESVEKFFHDALEHNGGIFLQMPTVHLLSAGDEKRKLTQKWMEINTKRLIEQNENQNLVRNRRFCIDNVMELINGERKEIVVVAAGPSLQEKMDILRKWQSEKYIISVGTCLKKLLDEGIRPNVAIIVDSDPILIRQIEGIEEEDIPLVVSDNVYWEITKKYMGPKYMIDRQNLEQQRWLQGGTVSFAALCLALQWKPHSIYLVGLDLAYPIMRSHAEGIDGSKTMQEDKLFLVDSATGQKVYTDNHLDMYRRKIEWLIAMNSDISFYNLSLAGAKIEGSKLLDI